MTRRRSEENPDDIASMPPARPSCNAGGILSEINEAVLLLDPDGSNEGERSIRPDKKKTPDDSVKEIQKGKELQKKDEQQQTQQQQQDVACQERRMQRRNRAIGHVREITPDDSSSTSSGNSNSTGPGAWPVAGPRAPDQDDPVAFDNIGGGDEDEEDGDEEQEHQAQLPGRDANSNINLVTTAYAIDDPPEGSIVDVRKILQEQRRRIIIGMVLLLIMIVAIVVPLSIFLPKEEEEVPKDRPPPPAAATGTPTQNPTAKPTQVNSICQRALVLSENEKMVSSIEDAGVVDASIQGLCPGIDINNTVLWFKMVGSGAMFEGNMCSEDTDVNGTNTSAVSDPVEDGFDLHVFSGSCDNLACVSPFDEASSIDFCGGMNWVSERGASYYLLISGEETSGNFSLEMHSRNDICEGSMGPLDLGGEYPGTNVGAPIVSLPECGGIENHGVWYSVMGTGSRLEATTCTSSSANTFDTQLAVFIGGCENLSCVVQNDDSPYHGDDFMCDSLSWVVWKSLPGELYHILVYGYDDETGNFTLKVREYNDDCEHAAGPLEIGFVDTGSTEFAKPDGRGIQACGGSPESSRPGIWWSTVGTGGWMVATMCTSLPLNGDYDSTIAILTGSCEGGLTCVAVNQDGTADCGTEAEVHWSSIKDQIYYILVHQGQVNPSVHTFGIELLDARNDRCELTFDPLQRNTTLRDTNENARPPAQYIRAEVCSRLSRQECGTYLTGPESITVQKLIRMILTFLMCGSFVGSAML